MFVLTDGINPAVRLPRHDKSHRNGFRVKLSGPPAGARAAQRPTTGIVTDSCEFVNGFSLLFFQCLPVLLPLFSARMDPIRKAFPGKLNFPTNVTIAVY